MKISHIILILLIISAKYALSTYKVNLVAENEVITEIQEYEIMRKKVEVGKVKYRIGRMMEEMKEEQIKEIHLVYDRINEIENDALNYQKLLLYVTENRGVNHLLGGFEIAEKKYIGFPELLKFDALKVEIFRHLKRKNPEKYEKEKNMKIIMNRIEEIGEDSILLVFAPAYCLPIPDEMLFFYKDKKIEVNTNPFYIKGDKKDLKMRKRLSSTYTYECY